MSMIFQNTLFLRKYDIVAWAKTKT